MTEPKSRLRSQSGPKDLPAGEFSDWLRHTRIAFVQENGADVACGECIACCASSHFIHIRPEETETIARIPRELLFPVSGLPKGNVLLGYDENGRCPMLADNKCSIYEHRPLTCRNYDCRVYTAAGIVADRDSITQRTRRWKFNYSDQDARDQHAAVKSAARFVREHAASFPGGEAPNDPAQLAVLAVKVSDVFLDLIHDSGRDKRVTSDSEIAHKVVRANEAFHKGTP